MVLQAGDGRPSEKEAVRTTIVGGRPPGCGCEVGPTPHGIEVLTRKAAVDPDFRELLLNRRAAAADEIGLQLTPTEAMMLNGSPRAQLEAIIGGTKVRPEMRSVFLGKVAAAMLAALGIVQPGCGEDGGPKPAGIRPDKDPSGKDLLAASTRPTTGPSTSPVSKGVRPDRPASAAVVPAEEPRVRVVIGATVDLPVRDGPPVTVNGITVERPVRPADEPVEVAGARATRPASMPATAPATTRATTEPVEYQKDMIDDLRDRIRDKFEKPRQPPAVAGVRGDRPRQKSDPMPGEA